MKKIILFICAICCAISVVACGDKRDIQYGSETVSTIEVTGNKQTETESTTENRETTPFWEGEKYAYIIKPGEERTLHYDVDNDGEKEEVIVYAEEPQYIEEFPITKMKIVDNEKVLFETENLFDGLSAEYNSYMYFIVSENDKNYLLEFCHSHSGMGEDVRTYRVMEFLTDNKCEIIKEGLSDLSTTGHKFDVKADVEDAVEVYETVMNYITKKDSILLFDLDDYYKDMVYSSDDNVKYADERIEKNIFFDTIEYDGEDISVFREKVKAYCEMWIEQGA